MQSGQLQSTFVVYSFTLIKKTELTFKCMYYSFICTTETSADTEGSVSAEPVNSNSVSSRLFLTLDFFLVT